MNLSCREAIKALYDSESGFKNSNKTKTKTWESVCRGGRGGGGGDLPPGLERSRNKCGGSPPWEAKATPATAGPGTAKLPPASPASLYKRGSVRSRRSFCPPSRSPVGRSAPAPCLALPCKKTRCTTRFPRRVRAYCGQVEIRVCHMFTPHDPRRRDKCVYTLHFQPYNVSHFKFSLVPSEVLV